MMKSGRLTSNFFTKEKLLYQEVNIKFTKRILINIKATDEGESHAYTDNSELMGKKKGKTGRVQILVPKKSSLKHRFFNLKYDLLISSYRLRTNDLYFLDFVRGLLEIDPAKRPTAREAMNHPWITDCRYNDPPYSMKKV